MNRRFFLVSAGACALATHSRAGAADAAAPASLPLSAPPKGYYDAEAERLTDAFMALFWNSKSRMFRAPERGAETVDSDAAHNNGYVFWPSILGLHALVEGEKRRPGRYRARIAEVFDGLEQYFDPDAHAYNAWLHFPGNIDRYYDDNGWAAIAFVEAFEATQIARYRDRAAEMMEHYLRGGWDSGAPGGMRWGTSPKVKGTLNRTACSTASTALAALFLARAGVDRQKNTEWARALLLWIRDRLQDSDSLVRDGLSAPDWKVNSTKWTYNTGAPMRGWVEHYRLTKDRASLDEARRLAVAATDRSKRLYDGVPRDPAQRFWYDSSFFVPNLVDGLVAFHRETREAAFLDEVKRNANYAYQYLRDPADGLYWRNWRLWKIGEAQYERWRKLTGQDFRLEPDESERSKKRELSNTPLKDRPLVKTLLANAGMARLFWMISHDV
ncbi:MAG: hypothetical protein NTX50_15205 [Candidatus Sumerlaeota bacterium]|nr:hypothetical protein [Candidatus Sumerlaeota bacterium]